MYTHTSGTFVPLFNLFVCYIAVGWCCVGHHEGTIVCTHPVHVAVAVAVQVAEGVYMNLRRINTNK